MVLFIAGIGDTDLTTASACSGKIDLADLGDIFSSLTTASTANVRLVDIIF